MKKFVYLLFIYMSWSGYAQRVRPFGELSLYRDSEFKNSSFIDLGGGIEVFCWSFLKPEIHISYTSGDLEYQTNINQGVTIDLFERKVSAVNFCVVPKVVLTFSDELFSAGDIQFQISPRYMFSNTKAMGYYTLVNQSNPSKSVTEEQTETAKQHSLGIGIGIDIQLSDNNNDSLAFNLYYDGVDFGASIAKLNHQNTTVNTDGTFGFGVVYYFGFKKESQTR